MGQALQQLIFTSLISRGYKVKLEPHRGRLVPATEAIIPFRAIKPRPANISHPKNVTAPPIVTLDANPSDERQTLTWTDPATGIPTTVDARTGNTVLSQGSECVSPLTTGRSGNLPVDRSRLKTFRPTDTAAPAWMDNALLNWHGHLLGPRREMESHTQPPITSLDSPSAAVQASSNFFHSETFGTLDRVQLNEGKVISQFDEKFILLRHESVLYLVDQHAASERIQVEGYLRPLCSLNDEFETVPWKEQNRNILVSKSELATALCQLETFSRWGIFLEPPQQTELDIDAEWYTFSVIAVPKCVHARLSREIHLLQALISKSPTLDLLDAV